VASASLRLCYSLLYLEHINHIQVLGFLPFPYISCACSHLSVYFRMQYMCAFRTCTACGFLEGIAPTHSPSQFWYMQGKMQPK
jgi:hypothetical protein